MADTFTTNYGLTKPEPGTQGWDAKLNSNMDQIDSLIAALFAAMVGGVGSSFVSATTVSYTDFNGAKVPQPTLNNETQSLCAYSGTLQKFRVKAGNNSMDGVTTVKLYKNGLATGIQVAIPAGSTTLVTDAVNVLAVNSGDTLTIVADATASTTGVINSASWSVEINRV